MTNVMQLIALKIACGNSVFVAAEGERRLEVVGEMVDFLEGDFQLQSKVEMHEVDRLLHENALMQERLQLILEAVQDGICVVDKNGEVTYVNCPICGFSIRLRIW